MDESLHLSQREQAIVEWELFEIEEMECGGTFAVTKRLLAG